MTSRMEGSVGPVVKANGPISAPDSPVSSGIGPPPFPEGVPQSPLTDITQMWMKFGKTFAVILPIYILGYFEFSFSWVLIGLAALFYWRKNHGGTDNRINRAMAFLEHEEKVTKHSVPMSELPPWVNYPDVERVEWLNKTVKQMWPFICQFVDKLFRETIEPAVQTANPYLSSFCFSKIDMGDKPLRINGVKVYTENVDKRQIIMDLQISFVGNTEIDVDIKKFYCRAGIKSIQLQGTVRVVMEPLLGDMPLIGALSVFFVQKPFLDINWTGLTNMLDIPGINGLFDTIVQDIISSQMVLPNRITIPLVEESQLAQLRFPMPKGILRIHFIEAQDLLGKDKFLGGLIKGKSDPYGFIKIGTHVFQSKVIHDTVNPKWNEVYEALIYANTSPNLEIELFDEDTDKDDFLGSLGIDLAELQKEQKVDEWFVIEDVATGKLHLKLEWLSLLSTPEKLDQVLASVKAERGQANDGLSSALLVIFLDSARNLPSGKKLTSDPSPQVHFTVGHKFFESKTRYKTNEPVWEETFTFLIHNPKSQELQVEVKDEKHECSLGTLTVPLSRLLEAEDMTLNQRFPLRNSGPNCTLKMKMALRVLCFDSSPSSAQVNKNRPANPNARPSSESPAPPAFAHDPARSSSSSAQDILNRRREAEQRPPGSSDLGPGGGRGGGAGGRGLGDSGRSTSNLTISGSQQHLAGGKEPTPSIASDISNPCAAQELQQRLQQLQNGSGPNHFPLGEVQLTVRHSSQRNKLIVVVHGCRNLITFSDHGSDPYVRLYLLPDKRRSGRRKTHTFKKTLNPVYDQTFEFSISLVELHRRTLDVAVKNGGGLLSKHKGLLGKVLVDLTHEDTGKGWTQWYELSEDGLTMPHQL
ncbi:extended synaptotagmin-2 isoform X2 [Pseudoliparis swirei]|uniref:extended synaptotagmin-2 isoform X2 n=1 Tax=Pseudoliparis swirei TaxID=2059687 RepID=UPI0024BDD98A|nr:extended synaptotagmin-2 isoform X2 [Pseudoliparis swirei]